MEEILVSVVIPIYNVEKYLNKCVESVVKQTYRNLEIILVDDGSPDNCPAMCDAWARQDSRIRVIHKENAGQGMARNSGLEIATGEYIFFFDSDDYVDLTTIEKCVHSAQLYQADGVFYGRCMVLEDGTIIRNEQKQESCVFRGSEILEVFLPGLFTYQMGFGISAWGRMHRRELLERAGLRFHSEREIISEDAYFTLEFCKQASVIATLPEELYHYLKRDTSFSHTYRKDRQARNDDFLVKSLAFAREGDLPEIVHTHLKVRYHYYTIAALKQIMAADLSEQEKRHAAMEVFNSEVLRKTLTTDVLRAEGKKTLHVFFALLKLRCYGLCLMLLRYRINKENTEGKHVKTST